jgi:hypothetical protein
LQPLDGGDDAGATRGAEEDCWVWVRGVPEWRLTAEGGVETVVQCVIGRWGAAFGDGFDEGLVLDVDDGFEVLGGGVEGGQVGGGEELGELVAEFRVEEDAVKDGPLGVGAALVGVSCGRWDVFVDVAFAFEATEFADFFVVLASEQSVVGVQVPLRAGVDVGWWFRNRVAISVMDDGDGD